MHFLRSGYGVCAIVAVTILASLSASAAPSISAQLAQLHQQLDQLEQKMQGRLYRDSGLSPQAIQSMVQEVMADAQGRASLRSGRSAGHGKKFFIASDDGSFLLQLGGQIQMRYLHNTVSGDSEDDNESGFVLRRAKIRFTGHVFDPRLKYAITWAVSRSDNEAKLQAANIRYEFTENYHVRIGQFKAKFLRENGISSRFQQAADRSAVNANFAIGYTQGVELGAKYDHLRWAITLHDGRQQSNTAFNADTTRIALAGRAEYRFTGRWKQFKDFAAWPDDDNGLMVGVAGDYEQMKAGGNVKNFLAWTADVSLEASPANLFVAVVGRHGTIDDDPNANQLGLIVQSGLFLIPQKLDLFARWEWLEHDGYAEIGNDLTEKFKAKLDRVQVWTLGLNYYFQRHRAKLTTDIMWAPQGIFRAEESIGLRKADDGQNQTVIRMQIQLLF